MKVLIAVTEAIPYAKTGGLADVAGSLFNELRGLGIDARLFMPLYRGIKKNFRLELAGPRIKVQLGGRRYQSRIFTHEGRAYFVECNEFFDRREIYGTALGEYEDNALRFIFFSKAVLEACEALEFVPDIINANDWQTGLIPLYIKTTHRDRFSKTSSLLTIHNVGYQGIFPPSAMALTGLPTEMFNPDEIEFYGKINLLKAGIISADAINTVSYSYSREIMEKEFGYGLHGVLKKRKGEITGILNGIDYNEWSPAGDEFTPQQFSADDLSGKRACKEILARKAAFKDRNAPIAGMVTRLVTQKGIELLLEALEDILSTGMNVIVLGKGDDRYQRKLREFSRTHRGRYFLHIGYDEALAHLIYAGSDIFLIPSRYEPCGLTQMIAMKYGAVPVARSTGGIVDTVDDFYHLDGNGTGFLFAGYDPSAFLECIKRALCVYSCDSKWEPLMMRCMEKDFSWKNSARRYEALYRKLLRKG